VPIRLLVDECVLRSVANVFVERGHDVHYVVEELAPKTPDPVLATYASVHAMTVVTWNVRHLRRYLGRRTKAGELAYPGMGLIGFQCPETNGEARLRAHIELIELEHETVQRLADKRLRVLIGWDWLRVYR
jgi:hypothetical protein